MSWFNTSGTSSVQLPNKLTVIDQRAKKRRNMATDGQDSFSAKSSDGLGWGFFRKSSPIKVCILWGNLDTYRVLLTKKV